MAGLRGRVEDITADKKFPRSPTIRVRLLGPDGKPGPAIDVKPQVITSANEKARIAEKGFSRAHPTDNFDEPKSKLPWPGPKKTFDSGSKWPDEQERKPYVPPPETPEQKERRLAAEEARFASDTELAAQEGKGPEVWRNAIAAEQKKRAAKKAADIASRQRLIDSVNAQAAHLSTTDAEARAEGLDKILSGLRFSIIDTDNLYDHKYPPSEGGEWTPERAALHEQMYADVLSQVEAAGIPKNRDGFVMGGLPGAGKTYMLGPGRTAGNFGVVAWEPDTELPDGVTHVSINPDTIKEMMAVRGMLPEGISPDLKPMEQATFLHAESNYLAKMFQDRLSAQGYNLALDRTFESTGAMDKVMAPLARKGYTFRGLFVDIPVDESLASTKKRYIQDAFTPLGGRFVPSSVQGNRRSSQGNMSKNRDAFNQFIDKDWFTEYMIVDNTGISATPPNPKGEIVEHENGDGSAAARYLPKPPAPAPRSAGVVPMKRSDFSNPDTPRTRQVTAYEYAALAATGQQQLDVLKTNPKPPAALNGPSWDAIKQAGWDSVQAEWGGTTIDVHTGTPATTGFALTMRPTGTTTVAIPIGSSREEFDAAMEQAKAQWGTTAFMMGQAHLGTFRNDDTGNWEIDPVLVVGSIGDVETIGAYTHANGGAYSFADGLGYWPPYV